MAATEEPMDRREALLSMSLGIAALAVGAQANAQGKPAAKADPRAALLAALAECRRTGELCVAHCASELAQGNKTMANCNLRVHEMLAVTASLATLAALESQLARRQAAVCADACKACKEACAEHKAHWSHGMHLICKECMEACETCERLCRAYAA
jgi:Cys-rich four helix bundle protein (predicted Tat secretion target)